MLYNKYKQNKQKAFTLIELIAVIAILAVLVLLATPKFMGYTKKAKLAEIKANIRQLESASELYYMDHHDWPRAFDTPYTSEELESFANEIRDKTGAVVTLEETGKYYPISYEKLSRYVQKPKDSGLYILQNPVGKVFYLDDLTKEGKNRFIDNKETNNNKPVAVIDMKTDTDILTTVVNITWDYSNSYDPDGDKIVNAKWEGAKTNYTEPGTYKVRLKVQDEHGLWSDWVEKEIIINDVGNIKQLISGFNYTYVITDDGKFKVWGKNDHGQLGIGNTNNQLTPVVNSETNIKKLFLGYDYTIALLNNATLKSWGWNTAGQLGLGNMTDRYSPTILNLSNVKQISTGYYHVLALLNDGTIMVWGDNNYGQLGIGDFNEDKYSPTNGPSLTNVKKVVAGKNHSFALMNDGTVYAWGDNQYGQLGLGDTESRKTPVKIPNLTDVKELISNGFDYTYAILNDGTIKVWGRNESGELGIGNTQNQLSPITLKELNNVKQIITGGHHVLALMEDGTVKAWGLNNYGQLGLGDTTSRNKPTTIPNLTNVKYIVAGNYSSFAILNDGIIRCWGHNGYGELHTGDTNNRLIPVIFPHFKYIFD